MDVAVKTQHVEPSKGGQPILTSAPSVGSSTTLTPGTDKASSETSTTSVAGKENAVAPPVAPDQDPAVNAGAAPSTASVPEVFQTVPLTLDMQGNLAGPVSPATQGIKGASNGQAASSITSGHTTTPVKGKENSTEASRKGSYSSDPDSDSSNLASNTPSVAKVPASTTGSSHDANGTAATAEPAAAPAISSTSQAPQPTQEQSAAPATGTPLPAPVQSQGAGNASPSDVHNPTGVSSAQLIQSMQHSEMRLGMHSGEFGEISINTSINHQSLSAQISMDHSELSKALAVHLPAIEAKLATAYGVEARVEVRGGNGTSQHSTFGQQPKDRNQSQGRPAMSQAGLVAPMGAIRESMPALSTSQTARLDIRI